MSLFPSIGLDPNIQSNTGINTAINTLQGLNAARKQALENQVLQLQMPYVQPKEASNINLTTQKANFMPYTATGSFLRGLGTATTALSPFGSLRNAPELYKLKGAQALANGTNTIGNIQLPNNAPLLGSVQSLAQNLLNPGATQQSQGGPFSGPQMQNNDGVQTYPQPTVDARLGQDTSQPPSQGAFQPNVQQPQLPMNGQQMARLQQLFKGDVASNQQNTMLQDNSAAQNNNVNNEPAEGKDFDDQVNASIENKVASPAMLQKYNYAKNLAKTNQTFQDKFGYIPLTFADYLGAGGAKKFLDQQKASFNGHSSKQFDMYKAFQKELENMKMQATQFFGGSIQPEAQKSLEEAQNPITWQNDPRSALLAYNTFVEIIRNEGLTAAQSVGKQREFDKLFPEINAKAFYEGMKQNPKLAEMALETLTPHQQLLVKQYHFNRKAR